MEFQKHKITFNEDNYKAAETACRIHNFSSVSELINRALEEWLARNAGQRAAEILSQEMVSAIENTILKSERRINRILYKLAVGDAELKYVVAIGSKFNKMELLPKIHEKSEREIRVTNGVLNLKTIIEQENGDGGVEEWHD